MKDKIWLSSPHMGGSELKYIQEAFEDNWIAPLGPHVNQLEERISGYTGIPNTAALSSGTAALHLALILAGVEEGDAVLCSSFTFAASANVIAYQKAIPLFIDSEQQSWNIDPDLAREAIEEWAQKGKKPKALILVHLYGMAAQVEQFRELCDEYEMVLIEDTAEALGSTYKGKHLGQWGDFAAFSFNGNKIITTSGGGALCSPNKDWIDQTRFLSTQARDPAPHYEHSHIGYNYRMSNICAAIGLGQMDVLDERVEGRRANFERYQKELSNLPGLHFQPEVQHCNSNRWLTCVTIDPQESGGISREQLREAMAEENIDARPLWKPMHMQPVFQEVPYYGTGVSDELFEKGLCLPSGTNMQEEDWDRIIDSIRKVWNK